jgi:hypothetical protein
MKINTRDLTFFILGILTLFIVESIMNWEESKKSFKESYHKARGL